jgi:hypothetical protein
VHLDDRSKSSTFKEVIPGGFFIEYLDQSAAEGDYISETFALGGSSSTVTGLQMGLVTDSNGTNVQSEGVTGVLGIGYDTLEATTKIYPNLPDQLVAQGLINTKAYSLYLNDVAASAGAVLFGGIDTDQFVGTLGSMPVQQVDGGYNRLNVLLTSLSFNGGGVVTPLITPAAPDSVTLDAGASYSYIDDAAVKALYAAIGATDDTGGVSQLAWVDCNIRCTKYDDFLSFRFGDASGPVINVPLAESIVGPIDPPAGLNLPYENACIIAFLPASIVPKPYPTLGDAFLRSAYVVYDLQNNEIAMAQSNFESTASNVVDISKGSKSIPLLSGVSSGLTRLPLSSTCPPTSSTSSSAAPTSSASTTQSSSGLPTSLSSTLSLPTSSTASSTNWSNSSSAATQSSTTSTYTTTSVYTITSCPPAVTNCPVGKETTETIEITTTFCPESKSTPVKSTTLTVYTTLTYTSEGHLTTETRSLYTTVCPVSEVPSTTVSPVKTSVSGVPTGVKPTPTPTGALTFTGGATSLSVRGLAIVALLTLGLMAM